MAKKPLILLTNDDGITSPGLLAAAKAAVTLGDLYRSICLCLDQVVSVTPISLDLTSRIALEALMQMLK